MDPQGSQTKDSRLIGELQFNEKPCLKEGELPEDNSKDCPLTSTQVHLYADTHEHTHTYT